MDAKTLNRTLAARLGRDEEDINLLCTQFADIIGEIVSEGDSVAIPSFGTFEPKKRAERVSVHPASGRKILVPPKLSVVFRPSAMLKFKVKGETRS